MNTLEEKYRHEYKDSNDTIDEMMKQFGEIQLTDMCSRENLTIENNVVNIKAEAMGDDDDDYNPFE
jgi:hypothetical protein